MHRCPIAFAVWGIVGFVGCDPADPPGVDPPLSEAAKIDAWNDWVDTHADCVENTDCATISPGCPLGCYAAIATDQVDAARDEIDRLLGPTGPTCDYECLPDEGAVCDGGTCALVVGTL